MSMLDTAVSVFCGSGTPTYITRKQIEQAIIEKYSNGRSIKEFRQACKDMYKSMKRLKTIDNGFIKDIEGDELNFWIWHNTSIIINALNPDVYINGQRTTYGPRVIDNADKFGIIDTSRIDLVNKKYGISIKY